MPDLYGFSINYVYCSHKSKPKMTLLRLMSLFVDEMGVHTQVEVVFKAPFSKLLCSNWSDGLFCCDWSMV